MYALGASPVLKSKRDSNYKLPLVSEISMPWLSTEIEKSYLSWGIPITATSLTPSMVRSMSSNSAGATCIYNWN